MTKTAIVFIRMSPTEKKRATRLARDRKVSVAALIRTLLDALNDAA